ncbi:MAG TPA: hypothetical protein VMF05_14675 [Stellaceae bacterium]|nr:hypothetical protein [Stellaceae bacterium]
MGWRRLLAVMPGAVMPGAVVFGAMLLGAVLLATGSARAENPGDALLLTAPRLFKICTDQTYALCAVAKCFVFDGVSYCRCDVKSGDSISLPLQFGRNQNVCTVNAEGTKNGYMVSTYSLPPSVVAPTGDQALYDCPAGTSNGAYAQCDGGICSTSSRGQSFPGFAKPLAKNQIICSCPITVASPQNSPAGYQIAGPYPCQRSFFANCRKAVANTGTGATIYVGAPTGVPRLLTRRLYGRVPPIYECRLPPWP